MAKIVTVTMNPSIDTNCQVAQVMAEHKLRCSHAFHNPGGGGVNVARAIKNLGGESIALFPAGRHFGEMLKKLLLKEGIDFRSVEIEGETRENFIVREETSGRQYRFGLPGPRMREEECEGLLKALDSIEPPPEYIVGSGSLPPGVPVDFYARLGMRASAMGAKYILDTSGDALCEGTTSRVFLIKPNMRELGQISNKELMEEEGLAAAARALVDEGRSEVVVVSLGAGGALLVTGRTCRRIHAPSVRTISKVGAGDSMTGGIVLGLERGLSLDESAMFGVAAGTAAVMTPGTELCRREDTERIYEKMRKG
ncbi:MAG TPA: 1-phosphofructokinase family hexose kinase [Desulfomonilia bacterium]|nr:1-phosphofructokinase family hexose kinase [Desulfomonilia bacterium]